MKLQRPYRITRADLNDAALCKKICRLHKVCFPDDDVLEPTEGYWWVVLCGKEVVGFCAMRLSSRWCDTGYLWRVAVHPAHRGHRLHRRMILVRERLARRLKWNFLISDTNQNAESANNLIAAGYKMYQPTWPYGYESTCYWKKALKTPARTRALSKKSGKNP